MAQISLPLCRVLLRWLWYACSCDRQPYPSTVLCPSSMLFSIAKILGQVVYKSYKHIYEFVGLIYREINILKRNDSYNKGKLKVKNFKRNFIMSSCEISCFFDNWSHRYRAWSTLLLKSWTSCERTFSSIFYA